MRIPATILLVGLGALLLLNPAVGAEDWLPVGELDKVSLRTVPAYTAIESEIKGSVETAWEKGCRECIRYAASVGNDRRWPVTVIYPDWENGTPELKSRMLVQLVLDPNQSLQEPRLEGLRVVASPLVTVAAYAYKGPYTLENFLKAKAKIDEFLKQKDIRPKGPPRHLYFSNTAWVPSSWRVSEVQVPVAVDLTSPAPAQ